MGISSCRNCQEFSTTIYLVSGSNPRVGVIQAAVVSLAKDPAIWDAFVKNEKVQELMRARPMTVSHNRGLC